jgi:hypothetical protein
MRTQDVPNHKPPPPRLPDPLGPADNGIERGLHAVGHAHYLPVARHAKRGLIWVKPTLNSFQGLFWAGVWAWVVFCLCVVLQNSLVRPRPPSRRSPYGTVTRVNQAGFCEKRPRNEGLTS